MTNEPLGQAGYIPEQRRDSLAPTELIDKLSHYFNMIDNPDSDLTKEEAQIKASEFFEAEIKNRFSPRQLNVALWMFQR